MTAPENEPSSQSLDEALSAHQITLPAAICRQLGEWCQMTWEANTRINLTRHTTWSSFVGRDLVDVLQLSALLPENTEILDIGSGGGVPGLVLAIVRPDIRVSVCDSTAKKARLLDEFSKKMKLSVRVFNDRAENVLDEEGFDCCTARAVGPMWKLLSWLDGRWANARKLYAFKGPRWRDELGEAKDRGFTRRLLVTEVARYPLHSTDPSAPPVDSVIVRIAPDTRPSTLNKD